MKVSNTQPFQIIYSLFQHEFLGYLFESYVVHLDDKGGLTFQHQNISSKNASEFASGLDKTDYTLIALMDSMQQDAIVRKFYKKIIKAEEFYLKMYSPENGNKIIQEQIANYLEQKRAQVLPLLAGKEVYEMGKDGEPAWKRIEIQQKRATVLFHFRRNEDNTHYFPTIKYDGNKLDFQYKGAFMVCNEPAYMVLQRKLYSFEKEVDGLKIKPFLNKKFIAIPRNVEETYYNKFVAPLIASFDVYAKGFQINSEYYDPTPVFSFSELPTTQTQSLTLFGDKGDSRSEESGKIVFDLSFLYGGFKFKSDHHSKVSVTIEKTDDDYIFHRITRKLDVEKKYVKLLQAYGLELNHGKVALSKSSAFEWLNQYRKKIEEDGFIFQQKSVNGKCYFSGLSSIDIEVNENIDWFDVNAIVRFGEHKIPFKDLRKYILKGIREFKLPNGEFAVIPESWFTEYADLFSFLSSNNNDDEHRLKKHHVAMVQNLNGGNLAKVKISNKLQSLRDFEKIDQVDLPTGFKGELRPYQKAGYDWLHFLNKFNFGGCLADDMGLGKTVQTLALLQSQKEMGGDEASLLVMPTSLIYNWEKEAKKFTPNLKIHIYSGTNREKNAEKFKYYDLILTSYGVTRLDIEVLSAYYFNYVILDESQAIKNPTSNIAKAVIKLKSNHRLVLSGTPLENSTLDLWSQMSFINEGLLGGLNYFKNNFLNPIEKKQDDNKRKKLYSIIKPFILRRLKSQVATELPEKVENVQYVTMSDDQKEIYDEVKSSIRNEILNKIEHNGLGKSHLILLQGLTKLRQIANHPEMVDETYSGLSGKMSDMLHKLKSAIGENHKILVFSQFVKHLSLVRQQLDQLAIKYAYLDGGTKDRAAQVEQFQNDEELKVFLISLKAGGVGLNLTKADYVFILDPWWNPAVESQAIDRAHRIGQKNRVFTYKFITKNTVEEKILMLQERKKKLAFDLITTEESFVKKLSREDIESILV